MYHPIINDGLSMIKTRRHEAADALAMKEESYRPVTERNEE